MEAKECDVDTGRGAKDLEDKMAAASLSGGIGVAPEARRVGNGFRINWMNMRDAATGKILWEQSKGWGDMYDREILARVPRRLLDCRAVSREVNFTSEFKMKDFRLEQRVLLHDRPFERWNFRFGFVMPGSTNTWQQVIEAADEMRRSGPRRGVVPRPSSTASSSSRSAACASSRRDAIFLMRVARAV